MEEKRIIKIMDRVRGEEVWVRVVMEGREEMNGRGGRKEGN